MRGQRAHKLDDCYDKLYLLQYHGKLGVRHVQALLLFFGILAANATCSGMSVAVIAMLDANSTESHFQTFDWTTSQVSVILSSHAWGLTAPQLLAGYLCTVYSAKNVYTCGMFVSGVLHALVPLLAVRGGWIAVTIFGLAVGLCQCCAMPCTQAFLSKWAPPLERSRIGMLIYNGALLGNVVSMALSGILANSPYGWPSVFYVFGLVALCWSIVFYFLGADSPADHTTISFFERQYIENSSGKPEEPFLVKKLTVPWLSMLTSLPMWALIIASIGHNYGSAMFLTQLPLYFKYIHDYDIDDIGMISALPYLCAWLTAFPIGWLTESCLKKGASLTVVRKLTTTLGLWGPALALLLLCLVDIEKSVIVVVSMMILAVCTSSAVICGYRMSQMEMSPNFAVITVSIASCFGNVAALMAPLVCGNLISDMANVHRWNSIFYTTALVYFLSNVVFVIFGSSKTQPWNEPSILRLKFNEET